MFPPNVARRTPPPQQPRFAARGRAPTPVGSSFREAYPAAVDQQAEDYDEIMEGYRKILSNPSAAGKFNPIVAAEQGYTRDADVASSIAKLGEYSDTGGLSPAEVQELRARGISPIRSVYANAARNADRQRSLSGGYSPNAGASSARMTRELSEQIAGQTSNVNAGIAEMQQSGRLSMAPQYADAAARESGVQKNIEASNVGARNRVAEFNATGTAEANRFGANEKADTLRGMTSLYGTTPALVNTFGNQAAQAAQLEQGANQSTRQAGLNMIGNLNRRTPAATFASRITPGYTTKAPFLGGGLYKNRFAGR